MCGRFSQGETSERIAGYFGAYPDLDLPDGRWNTAPTDPLRLVVSRDGERRLVAGRWNFSPFWTDAARPRAQPWINARSETALDSPAFGPALRSRRCVVPADAFYEWDRRKQPRQPYAIGPARKGELLALAGIWAPSGDGGLTAAILTTAPNEVVAPIHDRMPVVLSLDDLDPWLDPAAELAEIVPLMAPAPDRALRRWPVGTAVNRVAEDGPLLLRPVEPGATLGL